MLSSNDVYKPSKDDRRDVPMSWTTPRIIEIAVGLEINSYACAELV
jgi:coenzyme PQQ precursor peptide PqqA